MSDRLWPHGLQPTRLLCPWTSPGQDTGVGCHSLLQKISTQGLNPGLPHCRQILYHLTHQGRLKMSEKLDQNDCISRYLALRETFHSFFCLLACLNGYKDCLGFRWGGKRGECFVRPGGKKAASLLLEALVYCVMLQLWTSFLLSVKG